MKSPSWGTPSGNTENSLWVVVGSAEVGSRQAGPKAKEGDATWGRAGARGRLYLQAGGTSRSGEKAGEGAQRAAGAAQGHRGRRGPEGRRAPQGRGRQGLCKCTARGGIREGGREAGAPHLRGGGGAAAAHGGAGGARRRRRARSYAPEPLGMRAGGRPGRARPGPARLGGDGSDSDGGKNSGGGAARGRRRPHPPAAAAARLRLRSCCCSFSPAERGGRRRRHLPLAPASHHPRPVPLPLPLPGCSRLLLGAARVSHQTPRPQCSAAPRGRRGDGSQNVAGPLGARRSLRGAGPISRWHRGRALPRGERASEAEAPEDLAGSQQKCSRLASGPAEGRGGHRVVLPLQAGY